MTERDFRYTDIPTPELLVIVLECIEECAAYDDEEKQEAFFQRAIAPILGELHYRSPG